MSKMVTVHFSKFMSRRQNGYYIYNTPMQIRLNLDIYNKNRDKLGTHTCSCRVEVWMICLVGQTSLCQFIVSTIVVYCLLIMLTNYI
jgi:hypothetical protein